MKTFSLICGQGHEFDLMVKSAQALTDQQERGLVTCPYCDSVKVNRALSRPTVKGGKSRGKNDKTPTVPVAATQGPRKADIEKAYKFFSKMRSEVEATHENVGNRFADEARAMHYGEKEERGIYGQATPTQVKDLVEEGVSVAPLPDLPKLNG